MGENKKEPFFIQIKDHSIRLDPENCGVVLFRDEPEKDYLDRWEWDDNDQEVHSWIFNNREMVIWMAGAVAREKDLRILRKVNKTHGTFRENAGWNPSCEIEDTATPTETELYIQAQLGDLKRATGADDMD